MHQRWCSIKPTLPRQQTRLLLSEDPPASPSADGRGCKARQNAVKVQSRPRLLPFAQQKTLYLEGFCEYRYRDSNCVANPVTPVFIGFLGPISPAGGSWGQAETGHAAPKMPPALPPVSRPDSSRPETPVEVLLEARLRQEPHDSRAA
jgi:hypothetical protein